MLTADEVIALLQLQPHPKEGGFFRETYRSADLFDKSQLPDGYAGPHSAGTAIYYLLTPTTFSAMHRLATDEVFHFYLGDPVRMLQLEHGKDGKEIILGTGLAAGQTPQWVVPRGAWQGSMLEPGGRFALLGCTVAPGFDYADYEHSKRAELIAEFTRYAELITQLTTE